MLLMSSSPDTQPARIRHALKLQKLRPHLLQGWQLLRMVLLQVGSQDAVVVWPAVGKGQVLQLHHQHVQAQHARQRRKHLQTQGVGACPAGHVGEGMHLDVASSLWPAALCSGGETRWCPMPCRLTPPVLGLQGCHDGPNHCNRTCGRAFTWSVSLAILACLAAGMDPRVRMLCSRSASLTTAILSSLVMATNSCCRSRAFTSTDWAALPALLRVVILLKRVSPSTITLTCAPKATCVRKMSNGCCSDKYCSHR